MENLAIEKCVDFHEMGVQEPWMLKEVEEQFTQLIVPNYVSAHHQQLVS